MRFKRLDLKNFRAVRELRIDFEPDLTVIVGRNGAGKTSILDALGAMARWFRNRDKGIIPLDHTDDEYVRSHVHIPGHTEPLHKYADSELDCGDVREGTDRFELRLKYGPAERWPDPADGDSLEVLHDAQSEIGGYGHYHEPQRWLDVDYAQPLFIYYRQTRGFQRDASPAHREPHLALDRKSVKDLSLAEDIRAIGDLEAWWNERDAEEARIVRDSKQTHRDPQLEAIRELVTRIDGFSGIKYSSTDSPPGLRLLKTDKTAVHVSRLSGGERSYIILLADLARRLQVFAANRPLDAIPAIVLIDEIELNLHPAWQSEIAPMLTGIFKACQFVVTTHSPQVLSGLESRNVRVLSQNESGLTEVSIPLSTRGRTSNYLLEGVLGASERYPPINGLVVSFNEAVEQNDKASAEKAFASLEKELADDTAKLLVLRKRLKQLRDNG